MIYIFFKYKIFIKINFKVNQVSFNVMKDRLQLIFLTMISNLKSKKNYFN